MSNNEPDTGLTQLRHVGSAYLALTLFTLVASLVVIFIPTAYVLVNPESIINEELSNQVMESALQISITAMIAVSSIAIVAELIIPYLRAKKALHEISRTIPRIKGLVKAYIGILPIGGIISLVSLALIAGFRDELARFVMNEVNNILLGGEPVLANLPQELLLAGFVGTLGMVMTAVARAFMGLSVLKIGSYVENPRLRLAGALITVSQIIMVITPGIGGISPLSAIGLIASIVGYAMLYSATYYSKEKCS